MDLKSRPSSFRPRAALLASLLVASLALLATAVSARELSRTNAAHERERLVSASDQMQDAVSHATEDIESLLRAAGTVFATTEGVHLGRWRQLLTGMVETEDGGPVRQLGIITGRQALQLAEGEVVGDPGSLVAKFVDPSGGDVWAIGFDGGLPGLIERELASSLTTGRAQMSRIFTESEFPSDRPLAVIVRPIYLEESSSAQVATARVASGWVYALVDTRTLAPAALTGAHVQACTADLSAGGQCITSSSQGDVCTPLSSLAPDKTYRDLDVFGRRWRVALDLQEDRAAQRLVFAVLGGGGLLLALVLGTQMWMFMKARARATDLAALSEDLGKARDEAQTASRAKSDFLANMSHEIRTPMTAILGYAEMIGREEVSETEREHCIETIRRNGDHLLSVINDILDISKIESGRYEVEPQLCSPIDVVRDVAMLMRARAKNKGLAFGVTICAGMPERITTDPTRLRQILVNLLGNAIKFTRDGMVSVTVRCATAVESETSAIAIDVMDTGVGVRESQLSRLFQPFMQADISTTRNFGGTGLGLAISKHLAKMLGGDISVRSTPGAGSTFTVTIASGVVAGAMIEENEDLDLTSLLRHRVDAGERAVVKPLDGRRVLLAEDGLDNQQLLSFIVRKAGGEIDIVSNGAEALDELHRSGTHYDLVLMDMQMPVMDGYAATRKIRDRGDAVPVLALTAHAMNGDRDKCLRAGCTDYMTKPVNREALVSRCVELIDEAAGDVQRAA